MPPAQPCCLRAFAPPCQQPPACAPFAAQQRRTRVVPAAAPFTVEAKQNSLRRQRTAEKARMYNKSRKSEVATRMKKVRGAAGGERAGGRAVGRPLGGRAGGRA